MLKVLAFSAENGDKEPWQTLKLLQRRFPVLAVGKEILDIPDSVPEMLFLFADRKQTATLTGGCVVLSFAKSAPLPQDMSGSAILAFVPPDVPLPGCPLISCGLHLRDTITLSSIESDRVVLSVQRDFRSLSGEIIEIGEYPLIYSGKHHRALIAAAALLLLFGKPLAPDSFEPPS